MKAPIVLFVYNRPDHVRQTIEALASNIHASESILIIYSDAPKNQEAKEPVQKVRSFIKEIKGFKSITIIERDINWGLARSIIDGVTNVINQHGKVIVLEDDIVISPYFLQFMNDALEYYSNEKKVWHISGWNYSFDTYGIGDAFFWRVMNCWGWATWKDRWQYFEKDVDKLIANFTEDDIYRFNLNGAENFWYQVLANKSNTINTWAIFWYATIFKKNGLCLNPCKSFVTNIGQDGTGIHCNSDSIFINNLLCEKTIDFRGLIIEENEIAVDKIMCFYNKFYKKSKNIFRRIFRRIKK